MESDLQQLLSVGELARRLRVSEQTITQWVRENRIPHLRPSRKVIRFRLADVERAIARPAVAVAEVTR